MSTAPLKIEVVYPVSITETEDFGKKLSPQEQAAILGILQGLTNREIAQEMNLCERVIKNYHHAAYRKLGIIHQRQLFPLVIAGNFELRSGQEIEGVH